MTHPQTNKSHALVDELAVKLLSAASLMETAAPFVSGKGLSEVWSRCASRFRGAGNIADGLTDELTYEESPFRRLDREWILEQLNNAAVCQALIKIVMIDLGAGILLEAGGRERSAFFEAADMAMLEVTWVLGRLDNMRAEHRS